MTFLATVGNAKMVLYQIIQRQIVSYIQTELVRTLKDVQNTLGGKLMVYVDQTFVIANIKSQTLTVYVKRALQV